MFLRAPKHFKSGKQHIYFFSGLYIQKSVLVVSLNNNILLSNNNILSILNIKLNQIKDPNIYLNRLTLKGSVQILYKNGW